MSLQRYRINNCADIKDDKGGYLLITDVQDLESICIEMKKELEYLKSAIEKHKGNGTGLHINIYGREYQIESILDKYNEVAK